MDTQCDVRLRDRKKVAVPVVGPSAHHESLGQRANGGPKPSKEATLCGPYGMAHGLQRKCCTGLNDSRTGRMSSRLEEMWTMRFFEHF